MVREKDILVRSMSVRYQFYQLIHEHLHDWSQLVYAFEGVMTVRTEQGIWVVPPQRAVWIPSGVRHSIESVGTVSFNSLYFRDPLSNVALSSCTVITVSPLLRELIQHTVQLGFLRVDEPSHVRLAGVIADQLRTHRVAPLLLPMPRDDRALQLANAVQAEPGSEEALEQMSSRFGASRRTMERLYLEETGMTLGKWRQQLRLLHALRLLAQGEPVTSVALESGYSSVSAFIAMFRLAMGVTPSRYFTEGQSLPTTIR